MKIQYQSIGIIHTPFTQQSGMPIQPTGASGVKGRVELLPEYCNGLMDLEGFSHIIMLYHFHQSNGFKLLVTPFLDSKPHGVFATRAPKRPNPIGLSVVKLHSIQESTLYIENVDILDGTPLLDIKPYIPEFDAQEEVKRGWFEEVKKPALQQQSDARFK